MEREIGEIGGGGTTGSSTLGAGTGTLGAGAMTTLTASTRKLMRVTGLGFSNFNQ